MIFKGKRSSKNRINLVASIALLIAIVIFATTYIKADNVKGGSAKEIQISMKIDTMQVKQQLVISKLKEITEEAEKERAAETKRQDYMSYARQFKGNPYVLGGRSLTNGCDCSTFVILTYRHFGYNWPLGPVSSLYKNCGGKEVSVDDMKPGDIIIFSGFGHTGIYAGDGMILHAMDPANGICETKLFTAGGRTYSGDKILSVRRVLE